MAGIYIVYLLIFNRNNKGDWKELFSELWTAHFSAGWGRQGMAGLGPFPNLFIELYLNKIEIF